MMERIEQRYCIKFCQKLGNTQVETIRKIQQAFGDDAMSITMETSVIPEAKESTAGPLQRQGFVDCFFDSRGVMHHEYAPQGQTVTKEYYEDVLCRLRNAVRRKQPDLWAAKTWQLHPNNAPTHSLHLI
jgi:hypothetical protein